MARYNEPTNAVLPEGGPADLNPGDQMGYRHFGDGIAGRIVSARLVAYNAASLAYEDVTINSSGQLVVTTGGGSGGTSMVDDAPFIVASSSVTPAGAMRDETAPDSVDEGDVGVLRMSANRNLYVVVRDAAGNERGLLVDANGALAAVVSGTVTANAGTGPWPVTDNGGSLTVDNAVLGVSGGGVEAAALRVTVASDSTGVLSVDDNGGSLTVDGTVTVNAGTNLNTSALALETGGNLAAAAASLNVLDDWDETDRAKVNSIVGQAGVAGGAGAVGASSQRVVSAGVSTFRTLDLDETEEEIKATAGTVFGMWVTNTATATRFVKLYNATAANVVVGTTTPVITIGIPGNASDDVSGNFGGGYGITFDTAITIAATTGLADTDVGAPGVNDVIVNVFYS